MHLQIHGIGFWKKNPTQPINLSVLSSKSISSTILITREKGIRKKKSDNFLKTLNINVLKI